MVERAADASGNPRRRVVTDTTARAVLFDRYGDRSVLYVADVPMPVPSEGEVLVEVRAAGINPGEAGIRGGALHERFPATFPSGEGSDLARSEEHTSELQ